MRKTIIGVARQNNSGGHFIINGDVDRWVAVEGVDEDDVRNRFFDIIGPHTDFCSCCGFRWNGIDFKKWVDDGVFTFDDFCDADDDVNCVLHLVDGKKKRCVHKEG